MYEESRKFLKAFCKIFEEGSESREKAIENYISNKEFTIHEELLNTSSTILNNCYPKTWETTKDYVSNFYYPEDWQFMVQQKPH